MKWNAELYDQKHAFVYGFGENLAQVLAVKPGDRVLDLGCGTGYLTNLLRAAGADITGFDSSAEMVQQARLNHPETRYEVANAEDFNFGANYDAVFSNAVLHWVKNHAAMMRSVYNSLKPGGRFVAEMGGKGNVDLLVNATRQVLNLHGYAQQAQTQVWRFPALGEYTSELEQAGFRVTYATHFDRKTPLEDGDQGVAKWITMFGSQFFMGIDDESKAQMLQQITGLLKPHYCENGQWYADYKRLRFIAIKE